MNLISEKPVTSCLRYILEAQPQKPLAQKGIIGVSGSRDDLRKWRRLVQMPHRHALIIEDEILIAMEVEALLAELGFDSFDIAESPQGALDCALRRQPDLITADYRIIGGTGVEAVTAILSHLGPIPVVYVTGNADQLGARTRTVVDKPISPRRLAEACALAAGPGA